MNTTRKEVFAVPTPEFTKTWHPISHKDVIESVDFAIKEVGIQTVKENYTLARKGRAMFGQFTITHEKKDLASSGLIYNLGVRNSTDKLFAVGLCSGISIIVCDNMVFSGSWVEFRRHTSGLCIEELREISLKGVNRVLELNKELENWYMNLGSYEPKNFKELVYDAMNDYIFAPSKFQEFLKCHEEEMKDQDAKSPTYKTFHGGITRLNRGDQFFQQDAINRKLVHFVNENIPEKHRLKAA